MKHHSLKFFSLVLTACVGLTAKAAEQGTPEPLTWDSLSKQQSIQSGETAAHFVFSVTNVSAGEVVVEKVTTSCGCTAAQLPSQPWHLQPGEHGDLKFTMNVLGKHGTVTKTATVQTTAGVKILTLTAILPEPMVALPPGAPSIDRQEAAGILQSRAMPGAPTDAPRLLQATQGRAGSPLPAASNAQPPPNGAHGVTRPTIPLSPTPGGGEGVSKVQKPDAFSSPSPFVGRGERDGVRGDRTDSNSAATVSDGRTQNQSLTLADHQAVFRGDCASCHAEPAKGKLGKELYAVACGICHDAEHRATMVPLLGKTDQAANPAYWRTWITFGKPGSLMPAFAQPLGGPLDREQIESLADYLAGKNVPVVK